MSNDKIIPCLFISFLGLYIQTATAQLLNISNDTIFVNMEAEVQIIFPTHPTAYSTIPATTQYLIWDKKAGINIIPGSANHAPATLLVSEAGRQHKFTLIFKQDIDNSEAKLYYDYSTFDKLAQHVKGRSTAAALAESPAGIINKVKNRRRKKDPPKMFTDSSASYYSLLEAGEREFRERNYESAEANFSKAHMLRPADSFPVQRLFDISSKLVKKENESGPGNEEYVDIVTRARFAFDKRKYTEALEAYKRALEINPGDVYVTRQLQVISDILIKTKPLQKEAASNTNAAQTKKTFAGKKLSGEENYNSAVKAADDFFAKGNYDSSKALYNRALLFFKRDWPGKQIIRINKIQHEQALEAMKENRRLAQQLRAELAQKPKNDSIAQAGETKRNYNLLLASARSSYAKNDLINARVFYEQAMKLQPLQKEPVKQLKIITSKLEAKVPATETNNPYDRLIALADSFATAREYKPAMAKYKEASALKPSESYPKKRLKYVQSEVALGEKRKIEERERKYSDALFKADKAAADKNYDDARFSYSEALAIHPDDDYARRRLEIISDQIEKEGLEKLREDSLRTVEPVKKSKRKK